MPRKPKIEMGELSAAPDYTELGELLREARESYGITIADASAALHIKDRHLQAMEEGRFYDVPPHPYVTGYLKRYAAYLGLDQNEILLIYGKIREDFSAQRKYYTPPEPSRAEYRPAGWLVLTCLLLAGAIYYLWMGEEEEASPLSWQTAELPEDFRSLLAKSDRAEEAWRLDVTKFAYAICEPALLPAQELPWPPEPVEAQPEFSPIPSAEPEKIIRSGRVRKPVRQAVPENYTPSAPARTAEPAPAAGQGEEGTSPPPSLPWLQ